MGHSNFGRIFPAPELWTQQFSRDFSSTRTLGTGTVQKFPAPEHGVQQFGGDFSTTRTLGAAILGGFFHTQRVWMLQTGESTGLWRTGIKDLAGSLLGIVRELKVYLRLTDGRLKDFTNP